MKGQSRGVDCDGKFVIVSTGGAVELIDGDSENIAIVDPGGGDGAVIGSGWIGWSTYDDKRPLALETIAKAMEHATTAKE